MDEPKSEFTRLKKKLSNVVIAASYLWLLMDAYH